jgi:chemotaxis signal transduction protein
MSMQTDDEKYLSILDARARRLATAQSGATARSLEATVALCAVGNELIGIPVECAEEIIRTPPISPLPGLPPWLEGIAQIRGEIVTVVSLAKWFGVSAGGGAYMVVLAGAEGGLGLLVDSVLDFRSLYKDELATSFSAQADRPIRAMTRDLVALLDPVKLFASPAIMVGAPRMRGSAHAQDTREPKAGPRGAGRGDE